jgi:hypothetical protein
MLTISEHAILESSNIGRVDLQVESWADMGTLTA